MQHLMFKKEWREALKGCSAEVRGEVYEAILTYAFEGEVVEMSPMAQMAFNFIKLSIDAMRDAYTEKCEKNRDRAKRRWHKDEECQRIDEDANGCQVMPTDANAYQNMPTHKSECQAMPSDAIKSNQIKSNQNNTLSLSLSGENDKAELTEEERKKIFEFFYWDKNLKYANEETERFIAHYEANGWCRGNSDKPVKSKVALAKLWDIKMQETRWAKKVNDWLHKIYKTANQYNHNGAFLYDIAHIETDKEGVTWIYCTRDVVTLIEAYKEIQPTFGKIMYRIKKTNN